MSQTHFSSLVSEGITSPGQDVTEKWFSFMAL